MTPELQEILSQIRYTHAKVGNAAARNSGQTYYRYKRAEEALAKAFAILDPENVSEQRAESPYKVVDEQGRTYSAYSTEDAEYVRDTVGGTVTAT